MVHQDVWRQLRQELLAKGITLVAVSKTKPVSEIKELYDLGQRDFGENYVQELIEKHGQLPADIRWHYIGHLQSNKVKYIAPFVHLIHAVDSYRLLEEINKQAQKCGRTINVLLQMHIADEETKFGLSEQEIIELLGNYFLPETQLNNVRICGLMGMATNTTDVGKVRKEFTRLHAMFNELQHSDYINREQFCICSSGMSSDYKIAIQEGSTMVRIGSLIFGERV